MSTRIGARTTRLLGVALLASVCVAIVAGVQAMRSYRELQATRLHPLGLAFLPAAGAEARAQTRPLIAYLGDSRVEDWSPSGLPPGAVAVNLGLDTQTSAQVMLRWSHHVTPRAPQVVVIQVGINDLKTIPLFPELRDEIVDGCFANIRAMLAAARQDGSEVVLTTIVPPGPIPLLRRPVWSDEVRVAVDDVNARLLRLAGPGVQVLDVTPLFTRPDGSWDERSSRDALHLTSEAYARLDRALEPLLKNALAVPEQATRPAP